MHSNSIFTSMPSKELAVCKTKVTKLRSALYSCIRVYGIHTLQFSQRHCHLCYMHDKEINTNPEVSCMAVCVCVIPLVLVAHVIAASTGSRWRHGIPLLENILEQPVLRQLLIVQRTMLFSTPVPNYGPRSNRREGYEDTQESD